MQRGLLVFSTLSCVVGYKIKLFWCSSHFCSLLITLMCSCCCLSFRSLFSSPSCSSQAQENSFSTLYSCLSITFPPAPEQIHGDPTVGLLHVRLESLRTFKRLLEGVSPAGISLDVFFGYLAAHGVFGENLGGFRDLKAHLTPTSCRGQGHPPQVQVAPSLVQHALRGSKL